MHNDRKLEQQIGSFRIEKLYGLALLRTLRDDAASGALAKRYVRIALEISRHYKIRMPDGVRNRLCKSCGNVLVPGRNCTVRVSSEGFVAYRCECGHTKRLFLGKDSKN